MSNIADTPQLQQLTQNLEFVSKGMLGFESLLHFELSVYEPDTPFYWLRSLEDPEVAFIVMEPCWLVDDYSFDLGDEEMNLLKVKSEQDIFVLVVCTIPENPFEMTANLLGPLIFHRESRLGCQLILDRNTYPVRFPVLQSEDPAGLPESAADPVLVYEAPKEAPDARSDA